ncbi:MAG: DUF6788 family protein [Verrucomicrobiota bacterium]
MSDPIDRKTQILREMAEIDQMQRGRLSEQFFVDKRGGSEVTRGPYYSIQRWCGGKNICERVSAKDVPSVHGAIEGYERFEKLAQEFVEITEQMTRKSIQNQDAKKNATKSAKRSSKKPKPS